MNWKTLKRFNPPSPVPADWLLWGRGWGRPVMPTIRWERAYTTAPGSHITTDNGARHAASPCGRYKEISTPEPSSSTRLEEEELPTCLQFQESICKMTDFFWGYKQALYGWLSGMELWRYIRVKHRLAVILGQRQAWNCGHVPGWWTGVGRDGE